MKKTILFSTILSIFTLGFIISNADSRRRKKKVVKNSKNTAKAVKALQGKFRFNSTRKTVFNLLKKQIKAKFQKKIVKTSGDIAKDNIRKLMYRDLKKLKNNITKFVGKKSAWDTSIIDDQYAHKNNESVIAYIHLGEQKFFFFYNNQLYKIFISLPSKQFEGYNFAKFQLEMEKAYGKAKEVYRKGIGGETELHHLLWLGSNGVELWAMDKTDVYGNFVFILVDKSLYNQVMQSRKSRGVKVPSAADMEVNPIITQVTKSTTPHEKKKKDKKKK